MTFVEAPVVRRASAWHRANLEEWNRLTSRTQTQVKVATLVVVTVVAFHYSLLSLLETIGFDTPLAYVSLVPVVAVGLAWVNRHPRRSEPPIHDRQLDYIVGLSLLGVAVLAELVLPSVLGVMFWVNRVDLLFLPLFVAGSTVLLFGVRVAWRQKVALGYLLLAWPWLYTNLLLGTLGGFTSLTLRGLDAALRVFRWATPVPGGASEGLYQVVHAGHAFSLSVVTACSGVDGMVGFLVIGAAFVVTFSGTAVRKLLWLAVGMAVLWATNLGRLLLIFWAGRAEGEQFALSDLHPVAGLVIFCVGVGLMGLLLKPFGLRMRPRDPAVTWSTVLAAPRFFLVFGLLLSCSLALCISQTRLHTFDPVASASGQPKLGSFLADPAEPTGWVATFDAEYTANKPFFGESSRWFRYVYTTVSPGRASLHSSLPVIADVIDTPDLSSFDAYGVTACYSFHGFKLQDVEEVHLADGVSGQALSFSGGSSHQNWSLVYWILPVETGQGTRYERVVLYLQNSSAGQAWVGRESEPTLTAVRDAGPGGLTLVDNRRFLVAFADQVIAGQARMDDTGVLVDAVADPTTTRTFWAVQADRLAGVSPRGSQERSAEGGVPPGSGAAADYARFWANYNAKHPSAGQPAVAKGR